MSNKIRLGILGGGGDSLIGVLHRVASAMYDKYQIVGGVFNPNWEDNIGFAKQIGLPTDRIYKDFDTLVEEELKLPESQRMQVVSILTPNFLHFPMANKLLENGFNVICEKPMTTTYEEAKLLNATLKKSKTVFAVTYTYTGYPMIRQMREMILNGELGKIQKIDAQYYQGWINPIIHDKEKQTIYYENAKLYLYDFPILYTPRFFHPDPTVKRQSGFLAPSMTNSTLLGSGLNLPYYFALAENKDATLNPKIYADENPVIQTEYRHVTKNSYSILDASFNQGYKKTSNKKTGGSRHHIFARSDIELGFETFDESKLTMNIQRVSNDTYLKVHDINSKIMTSNTVMNSSIDMNFSKNDTSMDINMDVYEDLSKTDERYEFVLPNYDYQNKLSISDQLGMLNFQSRGYYKNYETNKKQTKLVNDFHWKSNDYISSSGIITKVEGNLKNSNYRAENTTDHKNDKNNIELMGAVSLLSSLPLEKQSENYTKTLTPKLMLRTAPGHMRNMSDSSLKLAMSNLYSLNKLADIDVIETGTSLTLGTEYNYKDKNDFEKFNLSVGQVFNYDDNTNMPKQSTLNEKTSELVGNVNYYLNEFSKVGYKFSLDNNYSTLNYNEISGIFKINKLVTNFEYLEENNHIGNNHYINAGLVLELNESNSLKFKTRENFTTDATEFYNISYQYENDCLRAAIEYNKSFYSDNDLEPSENLMFTLTIIPFGKLPVSATSLTVN